MRWPHQPRRARKTSMISTRAGLGRIQALVAGQERAFAAFSPTSIETPEGTGTDAEARGGLRGGLSLGERCVTAPVVVSDDLAAFFHGGEGAAASVAAQALLVLKPVLILQVGVAPGRARRQ